MKKYNNISEIIKDVMKKDLIFLFYKVYDETLKAETEYLKKSGLDTRLAKKRTEEKILRAINGNPKQTFLTNKGIKYEAFKYIDIVFLLTIALGYLLNKKSEEEN